MDLDTARETVRCALDAADNANHAGEQAVMVMAAAVAPPEWRERVVRELMGVMWRKLPMGSSVEQEFEAVLARSVQP